MYNIKHNNLNEPMKNMFEISNNELHNSEVTLLTSIFQSLKPIL